MWVLHQEFRKASKMQRIPSQSLIDIIKAISATWVSPAEGRYTPKFNLLLGAGASITSGVMTAGDMVRDFKSMHKRQYPELELDKEAWYSTETEYSDLFERLFPEPAQRREHIEQCLRWAKPFWGYMYLVGLIENNVFNTVFTTNFDDLIAEACYQFSGELRPQICGHDSSVKYVRNMSPRPKVFKLHGDFLYDNIKNSRNELESLETNMRDKLSQYASEFGLIVVGYSGSDRSIMEPIDELLRSRAFPYGVYWCVRAKTAVSANVERLARYKEFHLVEVEGFDALMADMHKNLLRRKHPIVQNPIAVAANGMWRILNFLAPEQQSGLIHPTIAEDARQLFSLARDTAILNDMPRPYTTIAKVALENGNVPEAKEHLLQQLDDKAARYIAYQEAFDLGIKIGLQDNDNDFATRIIEKYKKLGVAGSLPPSDTTVMDLISADWFELAEEVLDMQSDSESARINRAQILRWLEEDIPDALLAQLKRDSAQSASPLARFGALIVLNKPKAAVDLIEDALGKSSWSETNGVALLEWPIIGLLSDRQRARLERVLKGK